MRFWGRHTVSEKHFSSRLLYRLSLGFLMGLVVLALMGRLIANDKPLYCEWEGRSYSPALKSMLVAAGMAQWKSEERRADWKQLPYKKVIFCLIPFSSREIDAQHMNYSAPGAKHKSEGRVFIHWLGTDQYGRDVAAGLVNGAWIALMVGVGAMAIALLLGLLLGGLAGFWADDQLQLLLIDLILGGVGLFLAFFWAYYSTAGSWGGKVLWFLVPILFSVILSRLWRLTPWTGRRVRIPFDLLVMRLIETVQSIPGLLILLSLLAILPEAKMVSLILILGLLSWPIQARYFRAELLKVRRTDYVEAARAVGLSPWRIFWRHATPNALGPVLVATAFGVSGAILAEATLSFLGIGVPADMVSWGGQLQSARGYVQAWWLAVFPGLMIFFTVTAFNILGARGER